MTPKISPSEWEFEFRQRDIHPPIMTDFWLRAIRDYMPKELCLSVKSPDYLFTATDKGYIKSRDKRDMVRKLKEGIRDRTYLDYIFHRTLEVIENFDTVAEKTIRKISRGPCSKEDIARLWESLEPKYLEMVPWFYIPWYLTEENFLSDVVKIKLEKYRGEVEKITDFNSALGILLFPTEETTFQPEQRDFFALVKTAKSTPSFESDDTFRERAREYLKKYSWMRTYFLLPIELLSEEELLKRVREACSSDLLDAFEIQQKKKIEHEALFNSLSQLFRDDKELVQSVEDARLLGWLLTVSVERGIFSTSKLIPFYKILAKELKISYEQWVYLTSEEIKKCLRDNIKVKKEVIHERRIATAAVMQGGTVTWLCGNEAKIFTEWVDTAVGGVSKSVSEFSGWPVYPGKVTGRVRVGISPNKANFLEKNEILITSMTSPDYVPAMRKAAAIVTDEGGLLCHAAIISRELGKPCIVGTKIGTKVLKDGDVVEVDAERGVVKVLKKAGGT